MKSRNIRVAAGAALVFGLLSWIPAGAVTIGYPPAEPGGRCLTGFSVPLSGGSNQLYKCVNDQWAVVRTLDGGSGPTGSTGATGAAGTNGTNGVNGAPGAPGAPGDTGADGTNGTNGENGAPGAPGAPGEKGDPGPAGPALAAFGLGFENGELVTILPGTVKDVFVEPLTPPAGTYAVNFAVTIISIDAVRARCRVTIDGIQADDVSQPVNSYAANDVRGSLWAQGGLQSMAPRA